MRPIPPLARRASVSLSLTPWAAFVLAEVIAMAAQDEPIYVDALPLGAMILAGRAIASRLRR